MGSVASDMADTIVENDRALMGRKYCFCLWRLFSQTTNTRLLRVTMRQLVQIFFSVLRYFMPGLCAYYRFGFYEKSVFGKMLYFK